MGKKDPAEKAIRVILHNFRSDWLSSKLRC